jgi:hypothetical protein
MRERISNETERAELMLTKDLTKRINFNPVHEKEITNFFQTPMQQRITLLHSVRGVGSEEPEFITNYIKEQEAKGNVVYVPKKFNFQQDETGGIAICNTMRYAIHNSGQVAIGYNPDSEGIKFDYGITLYNQRCVTVLNPYLEISDSVYNLMKNKKDESLEDFIYDEVWLDLMNYDKVPIKLAYVNRPDKDGKKQPPALAPRSALQLGMIYASEKPFLVENLKEVRAQAKLEEEFKLFKSYSKVVLKLHEIYNP